VLLPQELLMLLMLLIRLIRLIRLILLQCVYIKLGLGWRKVLLPYGCENFSCRGGYFRVLCSGQSQ